MGLIGVFLFGVIIGNTKIFRNSYTFSSGFPAYCRQEMFLSVFRLRSSFLVWFEDTVQMENNGAWRAHTVSLTFGLLGPVLNFVPLIFLSFHS